MNPVKIYDYLTTARDKVFDAARSLPPDHYNRTFAIGLNTIGRTLTHMMIVEWSYSQRMQGRDLPPYETWPIQDENPPVFEVIERTWREQAPHTRAVIESLFAAKDGRWERDFTYVSQSRPANDGRLVRTAVTTSPADLFTQLALHEVHHRAQVMAMLRELGATVQDIDFGYMMFKRRVVE